MKQSDELVCSFTQSEWFGEGFFEDNKCPPGVSFVSENSSTVVLQLTRQGYQALNDTFPVHFAANVAYLASTRELPWLRQIFGNVFKSIRDIDLLVMGLCLRRKGFDDQTHIHQGNDLYVIVDGIAISSSIGGVTFEKGDLLNWISFDNGHKLNTTYTAKAHLETAVLLHEDFQRILHALPQEIQIAVSQKQIDRKKLIRSIPLFSDISDEFLTEFMNSSVILTEPADLELKQFYRSLTAVEKGELTVTYTDNTIRQYGPESYFGEISLSGQYNITSIRVSKNPLLCLSLSRETFQDILLLFPYEKHGITSKLDATLQQQLLNKRETSNRHLEHSYVDSVELIAGIKDTESFQKERESNATREVWKVLGETMSDCSLIFTTWPYYVFPKNNEKEMVSESDKFMVTIVGMENEFQTSTFNVSAMTTVAETVKKVFLFASRGSKTIDVLGPDAFTLKVASRNDFLVFRDIPLRRYKCISNAVKGNTRVNLALVDLRVAPSSVGSGVHAAKFALKSPDLTSDELVGNPDFQIDELEKKMLMMTRNALECKYLWQHHSRKRAVAISKDFTWNFRVKILGTEDVDTLFFEANEADFCIRVDLVYANKVIESAKSRVFNGGRYRAELNQWIIFSKPLHALPLTTRLCFSLISVRGSTQSEMILGGSLQTTIGGAAVQLFDYSHMLNTGKHELTLWRVAERALCVVNLPHVKTAKLMIEFEEFLFPLYYKLEQECFPNSNVVERSKQRISESLKHLVRLNPIQVYSMAGTEKKLLWDMKELLLDQPAMLSRIMFSVDWTDSIMSKEALDYLSRCAPPAPMEAMELLDCYQGDYRVREYAVKCLEKFSDGELEEYLLQLVQILKYETFHDSPLGRYLLRRAWLNPREIGTKFFWFLRSEMHHQQFSVRFGVLLVSYLENSDKSYLRDLNTQSDVLNTLGKVAKDVVMKQKGVSISRHEIMVQALTSSKFPTAFQLPLNPQWVVSRLVVEKCKVMNSKKKPLWLTFDSVDCDQGGGLPKVVIFKNGDDLRQDQMTLQLLRVMSQMWISEGEDMKMSPYLCITTGDEVGMIEIVTNSVTIANIQKAHGRIGALRSATLQSWLIDHAAGKDMNEIRENFKRSCAGYCVATYVMGIGDRHSDNIMLCNDGRLFHIDFGHFLGHFKSKAGFKRERSPFVFTKEMAFVLGGKGSPHYQEFVTLCCKCYNILRKNSNGLINLFRFMIPARIPELVSTKDIQYLCDKLVLDKTEEEAAASFRKEINICLGDTYRRFDNLIHNTKTG